MSDVETVAVGAGGAGALIAAVALLIRSLPKAVDAWSKRESVRASMERDAFDMVSRAFENLEERVEQLESEVKDCQEGREELKLLLDDCRRDKARVERELMELQGKVEQLERAVGIYALRPGIGSPRREDWTGRFRTRRPEDDED